MIKNRDIMNDLVQTVTHPFRQTDGRVGRCQQHRYERRRIKEYLQLSVWRNGADGSMDLPLPDVT